MTSSTASSGKSDWLSMDQLRSAELLCRRVIERDLEISSSECSLAEAQSVCAVSFDLHLTLLRHLQCLF
ncbi:unnamed protein product [Protopolystoma xenopodis]|uniref:Uncharacterized protein n=1 Tax=Protopolystoma xenopodis TaxID=117903 RepID=A0A448XPG3_9PLAT|nr:unnamed protein product [Protopolystoma xenopodis]